MKRKSEAVLNSMIEHSIIPASGTFEVTLSLIDKFYDTYREVYPPKTTKKLLKPTDVRFAKKMAGLSLMDLNIARADNIEYSKVTKRVRKPKCGIVYLISNPAFPGYYKVGMTKDLEKRLAQYQTGDPHRAYAVEHYKFVEDARAEEKKCLEYMKTDLAKGEWVKHERVKELFITDL